jgi:hypothetical protein
VHGVDLGFPAHGAERSDACAIQYSIRSRETETSEEVAGHLRQCVQRFSGRVGITVEKSTGQAPILWDRPSVKNRESG